ncbi:MAG: hypothetical protein HN348_03900, partial [Proteobacteria bacterium]|nr:hypothetical protein [Pseudomonadota bacterium]
MMRGLPLLLTLAACQDPINGDPLVEDSDTDQTLDTGSVEAPSEMQWVWDNPNPHGNDILAVWGAEDQAWAVGQNHLAMHWDGTSWSTGLLPLNEEFEDGHYDLWGWSVDDLAVGAAPGVVMWNGDDRAHAVQTSPAFAHIIWGHDSRDVWAIGGGVITKTYRYQGSYYEEVPYSNMSRTTDIYGTDVDRVVSVGWNGEFSTFDGSEWTLRQAGTFHLNGVYSGGPKEVFWLVGDEGGLFAWDGEEAVEYQLETDLDLNALFGTSAEDIWAVGEQGMAAHFDGHNWELASTNTSRDLLAIWGSVDQGFWAVGEDGVILHHDGLAWDSFSEGSYTDFSDAWAVAADDFWVVGDEVLRRQNGTWAKVDTPLSDPALAVWGSAADDLWVLSDTEAAHFDGGWNLFEVPWAEVHALSGPIAVGGAIYKFNGTKWTEDFSSPDLDLRDVWQSGGEAWAGGNVMLHLTGDTWQTMEFPWEEEGKVLCVWSPGVN